MLHLSKNAREIAMSWVKWIGVPCLVCIVPGCFLPFFAYGKISFVKIMKLFFEVSTDEQLREVLKLAGHESMVYIPFVVVLVTVALYILSWKALWCTVDYSVDTKYGWSITLIVSSFVSFLGFQCVKGCADLIGGLISSFSGGYLSDNVTGIGLIIIVVAYLVLFVLSIVALFVKMSYNEEKRGM